MSLGKIGARYGVTRQYIHYILARAGVSAGWEEGIYIRLDRRDTAIGEAFVKGSRICDNAEQYRISIPRVRGILKTRQPAAFAAYVEENRVRRGVKKMASIDARFDATVQFLGYVPSAGTLCSIRIPRCNVTVYRAILATYGSYDAYLKKRGLVKDRIRTSAILQEYTREYPDDRVCVEEHFDAITAKMRLFMERRVKDFRMKEMTRRLMNLYQ